MYPEGQVESFVAPGPPTIMVQTVPGEPGLGMNSHPSHPAGCERWQMEQQAAASLAAEYLVFQGGDTSDSPIQLAFGMKLEAAQVLGIDV